VLSREADDSISWHSKLTENLGLTTQN